jgi:hypothetical protein
MTDDGMDDILKSIKDAQRNRLWSGLGKSRMPPALERVDEHRLRVSPSPGFLVFHFFPDYMDYQLEDVSHWAERSTLSIPSHRLALGPS